MAICITCANLRLQGTEKKSQGADTSSQNGKEQPSSAESSQQSSNSNGSEPQQEDESRYPSKDWTAGGWAGGEKGLRQFVAVRVLSALNVRYPLR